MDHRQLSYFLAVCEACSITGAAAAAHISEQALSKTIRDLEGELGAQLFVRSNRGVEVTVQGEELMREARSYLSHHDAIVSMFAGADAGDQCERVSLGAPSGVMAWWLPDGFLRDFIVAHPEARFELHCFTEDRYGRPRHASGRDILFYTTPLFPEGWEVAFSASRAVQVMVRADDPLAEFDVIPLAALAGRDLGVIIHDTPMQTDIIDTLARAGIAPTNQYGIPEIPLMEQLVVAGRAVNLYGGDGRNLPEGTVVRPMEGLDALWSIYVLVRESRRLGPVGRELVERIGECLAQEQRRRGEGR